jgi:hypothetical protein
MPNFKSISKNSNFVKLFVGDKIHIANMIKENKHIDPRFADYSAAIRYYVHLGITAETATNDLRNSLDNTIVKQSQKEAVRNELKPLVNLIENLINTVVETTERSSQFFADVTKRTEIIEGKIDQASETIINLLKSILITGENALRNVIVLRSIIYIFFLGHKTGKIAPGKENLIKWNKMITLAHQHANKLSIAEVNLLSGEIVEAEIIQKMASDIFKQINSLPEPQIE